MSKKYNNYKEIEGDLIELALEKTFDVIVHGCNCFCTMKSGIAVQMAKTFECDKYPLETEPGQGHINKLGQIDYKEYNIINGAAKETLRFNCDLAVVNAYTQYRYGKNHKDGDKKPLDYEALTLCMRKINHEFKGKHIGLPQIGAGLAGGDWNKIKQIIQQELTDCQVTVVIYNK